VHEENKSRLNGRNAYYQDTGENCVMRSFMIGSSHKFYLDDHIKGDNMDGACGMFVEEEKCKQGYDE
jgi:hypothetical protein